MLIEEGIRMVAFLLVLIAIAAVALQMLGAVRHGRAYAQTRTTSLDHHKRHANRTIVATVLLIVAIEVFSQFSTVHMTGSSVFVVHLCFAVPFLVSLLLLRFWATGIAHPKLHGYLAYFAAFCFLGVLITGLYMLYGMM